MKKILAITLAALLVLCFVGCGEDESVLDNTDTNDIAADDSLVYENFKYGVNTEGNYEITGYVYGGSDKISVTIPSEIGGRPVTGIGDSAFNSQSCINGIVIPDSIKYIGESAFHNCDYITEISLPESVKTIGINAFNDCSALVKVSMPSVETISDHAFAYCSSLSDITLPETLTSIGEGAFFLCKALPKISIPAAVKTIGRAALLGCDALTEVTVLNEEVTLGIYSLCDSKGNTTIKAKAGSSAEAFAKQDSVNAPFVAIN